MGGKVWNDEEERVFWEVIIPQSPIAPNPDDRVLKWTECAPAMQEAMGDEHRREYTGSMLYEHFYQNLKPGPRPRAKKYYEKYIKDVEWYENNTAAPPSPSEGASIDEAPRKRKAGEMTSPTMSSLPLPGYKPLVYVLEPRVGSHATGPPVSLFQHRQMSATPTNSRPSYDYYRSTLDVHNKRRRYAISDDSEDTPESLPSNAATVDPEGEWDEE